MFWFLMIFTFSSSISKNKTHSFLSPTDFHLFSPWGTFWHSIMRYFKVHTAWGCQTDKESAMRASLEYSEISDRWLSNWWTLSLGWVPEVARDRRERHSANYRIPQTRARKWRQRKQQRDQRQRIMSFRSWDEKKTRTSQIWKPNSRYYHRIFVQYV